MVIDQFQLESVSTEYSRYLQCCCEAGREYYASPSRGGHVTGYKLTYRDDRDR